MRHLILVLSLLPVSAFAQDASDDGAGQSCPVGMVWDGSAQSCAVASNQSTPLGGLDGHVGCHGDATREVMS